MNASLADDLTYPLTGPNFWVRRPMSGGLGWDLATRHEQSGPSPGL